MTESPSDPITQLAETYRDYLPREERVIWLLGAGFSKSLGGPLFSELLSKETARWVRAWLVSQNLGNKFPGRALRVYDDGKKALLWDNAEECLSLIDQARTNSVAGQVLTEVFVGNVKDLWSAMTQFVAVATCHYVDQVKEASRLPEAWQPYQEWAQALSDRDAVISFNYDRVVEQLLTRTNNRLKPSKLHGTVPNLDVLRSHLEKGEAISEIATPGPGKVTVRDSSTDIDAAWAQAEQALESAQRLVVIGYSFPVSDPVVRSFVLSKCNATRVDIVVGPEADGDAIASMFARFLAPENVRNTRLTAQQFLAEGTARLGDGGRFNHWLNYPAQKK